MKRLILSLLLIIPLLTLQAQHVIIVGGGGDKKEKNDSTAKRHIRLTGSVYDSFTKAALKAHMTLMRSDSTVIDTTTCYMWSWGTSDSYYEFKVPRRQDHFIIKAECDGYHPGYINYDMKYIARNRLFEVPRILLKKKVEEDDIFAEGNLEGVVVTGTKVKIAYRGDTVVYNAAAFNLPEGSMLDGLVREMPGAELKDNGDIYVNGKKVDYLTLNGKDFFKGNNKVMLDNLPYYTVQNVEVYDKSSKESEWKGEETTKKDYVMDVKLKREYNRGLLANVEGGLGTDDRYLGRFFGLYYTDHTRLSTFANTNNINEDRKPGYEGDWTPANQPQGLRSTKQAGLNLTTENQDKNWEESFNTTFTWSDADDHTRTSSERFADDGSIFSGSESWSRQKDFRFSAENEFMLNVPIKLRLSTSIDYSNGDRTSESADSTWLETSPSPSKGGVGLAGTNHSSETGQTGRHSPPSEGLGEVSLNRTYNEGLSRYRTLNLNNYIAYYKKLPWGDNLSLGVNIGYSKNKPSDTFSRSLTEYLQTGESDYRDRYTDSHSDSYSYTLQANYTISLLNGWRIAPRADYRQTYSSSHNMSYRLDWLNSPTPTLPNREGETYRGERYDTGSLPIGEGWGGALPSNEQLLSVLDTNNSDTHTHFERTYGGGISFNRQLGDDEGWLSFDFPLHSIHERMHYDDGELDTIAHRSNLIFEPSFSWYRWGKNFKMMQYSMSMDKPDFASLMPTDDTTNPLVHMINNPHLKNRINHMFYTSFNFRNDSTARRISLNANVSLTQNAWGTRSSYDPLTGAYTYMQDNINGNWNASGSIDYERPLGKARLFTIENYLSASFAHSVDFALAQSTYAATESQPSSEDLSRVNTFTTTEDQHLKFQKDKLTLQVGGEVSWRHSTGSEATFQTINAWDYNYGFTAKYTIPWMNVDVATDLKMFSRRGYNSDMMNTDDLVWNASLSRSFFKGKLTARLMAFDILHQLSSTQYSVNAQGRTETWHNCIPRYALLTLSYKFQKMPKKKK